MKITRLSKLSVALLPCCTPLLSHAQPARSTSSSKPVDRLAVRENAKRQAAVRDITQQDALYYASSVRTVLVQSPPEMMDEDDKAASAAAEPAIDAANSAENNADASGLPGTLAAPLDNFVEVGIGTQKLSNGFGSWSSIYARSQYRLNERHSLSAEVERSRQFGDSGTYFALGDTFSINPDLYASVTVGSSTGGFYLPKYRVDAFLNRKFLRARNLVGTVGLGYYKAKDEHNDTSLYLGATYYFAPRWIIEGGIRFNNSNPGSVGSHSQFVALTNGKDHERFITLRAGNGRESYQLVAPGSPLVDFASKEVSLTVRQWIGENQGVNVVLEHYKNPSYSRKGVSLGYFQNY